MTSKLGKMTREEMAISHEIIQREAIDPIFRQRISFHLQEARTQLKAAMEDLTVPPEIIDELDYKIRTYGKMLSVALKMRVEETTKEDAFAEANITAQNEN
jgi:hypothetical protein